MQVTGPKQGVDSHAAGFPVEFVFQHKGLGKEYFDSGRHPFPFFFCQCFIVWNHSSLDLL